MARGCRNIPVTSMAKFARMTFMPKNREFSLDERFFLYRPNVAAIIVRPNGLVLAGRRQGIPDAWQLPQGGIEEGEDAETAVLREAEEETGLVDLTIVARTPDWIYYEWPAGFKKKASPQLGQRQIYFILREKSPQGAPPEPQLSDEFEEFCWLQFSDLIAKTVAFRREAYLAAYKILQGHLI